MPESFDLKKLQELAKLRRRYEQQLGRLRANKVETDCIETAVKGALKNIQKSKQASLVIYGEPQSGKTEMMICLTAKLLDCGYSTIVHLMNDSVDLLSQNLKRFKSSGLAPAAKSVTELLTSTSDLKKQETVVFCKKNGGNLKALIDRIKGVKRLVVIDDEADYATPNARINSGKKTPINALVEKLIGNDGIYIGVTATPARLNLNRTFSNDAGLWVHFPAHSKYTGQDVFFPIKRKVPYRLTLLQQAGSSDDATNALLRFLITSAYLNTHKNKKEENYTFLVHTSGKRDDHEDDRKIIEDAVNALADPNGREFARLARRLRFIAKKLYPGADVDRIMRFIVQNASRATSVVLNSKRDRRAAGDNATEPTSPFTIIIGGNIVSRGVTFPNLLAMYFTRNVSTRLQQDTYIQRARMFGARGGYLEHFELTIPASLYADWHRCFVFHRLALATIKSDLGSPVWIGDGRISVASSASIERATVSLAKGEMSFEIFPFSGDLDDLVLQDQTSITTLRKLRKKIGAGALPEFLIDYIESVMPDGCESLAIHTSSSIAGYGKSADKEKIRRDKGFIGAPQLEEGKFPKAIHHIKILHNGKGRARLFYRNTAGVTFIQRLQR